MAITAGDLQQLQARLGPDNVLTSEADLLVYSTDVGSPPGLLDVLLNRQADAVARCHSLEDVSSVVSYCVKRKIPVTPRAAATNALGGAVPKRGGVVLDLTPMTKRIEIDEAKLIVRVDAGVVMSDLQDKLNEVGLELPCYPTSGRASTIGGFVAMGGSGIHSTRNGSIAKHVLEVEGVGMDGHPFSIRDRLAISQIVGLGGATGIITTLRLRVVESTKDIPVVATVENFRQLQALTEEVRTRFNPKHLMVHNSDFFALRAEATGQRKNPFADKHALIMCFDDPDFSKNKERIERAVARHGGALADEKLAKEEWDNRFFPIRQKVLGPSLVAGEVFLPLNRLSGYLQKLKATVAVKELNVEGHVTADGEVYFFIFALDDERRAAYPLGWGTSARILWNAKRMGGRAYHPGVYLQAQAKSFFGKELYTDLKRLKKGGDPHNLINPGMCFALPAPVPEFVYKAKVSLPVPAPSLGMQLAMGDPVLMLQDKAVPYRRHKSLGVSAADMAADMPRGTAGMGLFSNDIWGADLPSLQAIPNVAKLPMTQTMRGKMVLAKAFIQGKIADPNTLAPALNVADATVEEAKAFAPDIEKTLAVMEAFRLAVQNEGVELQVKAVEVVEETASEATEAKDDKKGGLDIEAIKEQAKNTPEAEKAWVLAADCIVCNGCESACPTAAAIVTDIARVDRDLCIADGGCFDACPTGAIRPGAEDQATSAGWPEGSRLAGKFGV